MSAESVSVITLSAATILVVAVGTFVAGFGAFVWARALVKVANAQLVFDQLNEMKRPPGAAPAYRAPEGDAGRLPTKPRMGGLSDDDLERAVRDDEGTVQYDQDPDADRPTGRAAGDDRVTTTDANAGDDSDEPPVPGTTIVRAR